LNVVNVYVVLYIKIYLMNGLHKKKEKLKLERIVK
jgi:hypothetical protein